MSRRPLKTRSYKWPHTLAHWFVSKGMTPNQMSLLSIPLAVLGALSFVLYRYSSAQFQTILLIFPAICIQLRLLSNMLDGLMAVEENKKSPAGPIYNELPDRICDIIFLLAAGFACGELWLGWTAAILAVLTAYIRALGGALGFQQDFSGPMAKPHRMFVLTLASLLSAVLSDPEILLWSLIIIGIGGAITVVRRTLRLSQNLQQQRD